MTAQQLISILAQLVEKHGDHPVYLADWNEKYAPPAEANNVSYFRETFEIDIL